MSIRYGYYLPLADSIFDDTRFLGIAPKMDGLGDDAKQKHDKDGTPMWVVTALVKYQGGRPETETFTLATTPESAASIAQVAELSPIAFTGLSAGKWSKQGTDRTEWTFQVAGFRILS